MEEIKVKDILDAVANYHQANINYGECTTMGGIVNGHRQHIHKYYWVEIGSERIQDNGEFNTLFSFAQALQKQFAALEEKLRKDNIVYIREKRDIVCGTDYVWHCDKYAELECVMGIVKITPCKSFIELQKWLQKKAKFTLGITDMYECDVCQKRSDKSYSNFTYLAGDEISCARLMKQIKDTYKSGNKVVAILDTHEWVDKGDYEYERYGRKHVYPRVTISTPTGRNEKVMTI